MTQASTDVLRKSLDLMDRERKRAKIIFFGLLAMSVAFWILMILSPDEQQAPKAGHAAHPAIRS